MGLLDFFRKKKTTLKCNICDEPLGDNPGILRYVAESEDGEKMTFTMDVCTKCSDVLDKEGKDPREIVDE